MESRFEKQPSTPDFDLFRFVCGSVLKGFIFVRDQLSTADLNPHEGRLRYSVMPSKYMNIPDHPPID